MTKNNKIALKIAGYVSYVMATLTVFAGLLVLFNIFGAKEILYNYIDELFADTAQYSASMYRYMLVINSVFSAGISIYAGKLYLAISKSEFIILGTSKMLVYLGAMQLLFGFSLIPAIIAFCVAYNLKNSVKTMARSQPVAKENNFEKLAKQVRELKYKKESNIISKEEYEKQLNILLEKSVDKTIENN